MLELLLHDFDLEITETISTAFSCNCSKERVEKALISLGTKEIDSMIKDGKPIEVNCHFCNTNYKFDIEELIQLKK